MALDYGDRYPGQIVTSDPAYPYGKARNRSTPSDFDGTPWEEDLVNDFLGFHQSLLDEAGITPSGDPDEVGASQYLEALLAIANGDARIANWRDDVHDSGAGSVATARNAMLWSSVLQRFLAGANDAPRVRIAARDLVWSTPATPPTAGVWRFAESGTRVVAGTPVVCWYTDDGATWVEGTLGGPIVYYDSGRARFLAVRLSGGVYRSDDGATFTDLGSIGAMSGQSVINARALACNGTRWVVVGLGDAGTGDMALIKTSDDDGDNWTERTSPFDVAEFNGLLDVVWSPRHALFVACGMTGRILTSPDGVTWTLRTTGVTTHLRNMIVAGYTLVAFGQNTVLSSRDGITWVPRVVPTDMEMLPVSSGNHATFTESPIGVIGHTATGQLR